jgi:hypothetical protein
MGLGPTTPVDHPTGRYYCTSCFEATLEVQLAAMSSEVEWHRIHDSQTNFSYYGISSILDSTESTEEVISIENIDVPEPEEEDTDGY